MCTYTCYCSCNFKTCYCKPPEDSGQPTFELLSEIFYLQQLCHLVADNVNIRSYIRYCCIYRVEGMLPLCDSRQLLMLPTAADVIVEYMLLYSYLQIPLATDAVAAAAAGRWMTMRRCVHDAMLLQTTISCGGRWGGEKRRVKWISPPGTVVTARLARSLVNTTADGRS